MDTKWKNRKKAISFMIFFLGVTLTIGSVADIWKNRPSGMKIYQIGRMFEEDYQESQRFREYIVNRLDNFLIMATGGSGLTDLWSYYNYGGNTASYVSEAEAGSYALQEETIVENSADSAEAYENYPEEYGYGDDMGIPSGKNLTDEEKKKIADKYHDRVKGDKNLLYKVSRDGEVLYTNEPELDVNGGPPEGYDFFLYFDGEKVRIIKNGEELDVYGDGYYREDSQWYVPGYRNFPVSEEIKKVTVCMAAASTPVMYTDSDYGDSGSWQMDNSLYWLYSNFHSSRSFMVRDGVYLLAGLALSVMAFFSRKSRREAQREIAAFQAKLWVEFKALFLAVLFVILGEVAMRCNSEFGLWQEWQNLSELSLVYDYAYVSETASILGSEFLGYVPVWFWLFLFWGVYLLWNDVRYNRKIWKCGLFQKVYSTFQTKNLGKPLSRKMAGRNRTLFLAGVLYSLFVIGMMIFGRINAYRSPWGMVFWLLVLGTVCFLPAQYLIARKNMEMAQDMETLSYCVSEIRNGNYRDMGGEFSGHDMEGVMRELEDIRQGMAHAVDEQMKSERMKVELIANVSHDIKTPLTSIISYVQFLKQEEDLPDHVKDYVTILDEKSQRLKNMVMDVFAVSKAASGELPMHMEELDFGKLLRQTMADMGEEIDKSPVTFRTEIPEEPVMILADGQRLYRVFQNLFQNAIKYSLKGSRVYVSLQVEGKIATASVKNTSQMEIKKDMNFTERFARGDESRTDGGSGLGLSIAQSFTEACGGEFSWEVDADLFVVKVSFQNSLQS